MREGICSLVPVPGRSRDKQNFIVFLFFLVAFAETYTFDRFYDVSANEYDVKMVFVYSVNT